MTLQDLEQKRARRNQKAQADFAELAIGKDSMVVASKGRVLLLLGKVRATVEPLLELLGYEIEVIALTGDCCSCGSKNTVEEIRPDTFQYGADHAPPTGGVAQITAMVPVLVCKDCKFESTDYRGECLRDAAVREHCAKVEG